MLHVCYLPVSFITGLMCSAGIFNFIISKIHLHMKTYHSDEEPPPLKTPANQFGHRPHLAPTSVLHSGDLWRTLPSLTSHSVRHPRTLRRHGDMGMVRLSSHKGTLVDQSSSSSSSRDTSCYCLTRYHRISKVLALHSPREASYSLFRILLQCQGELCEALPS